MRRIAVALANRLVATRLQVMDVHAHSPPSHAPPIPKGSHEPITDSTTVKELFLAKDKLSELFRSAARRMGSKSSGPRLTRKRLSTIESTQSKICPEVGRTFRNPPCTDWRNVTTRLCSATTLGRIRGSSFCFRRRVTLAEADRTDASWQFRETRNDPPKFAFLGVRACELAAMRIQDRVFIGGPYVDPIYQQRRNQALVIAVNCTQAAQDLLLHFHEHWPALYQRF